MLLATLVSVLLVGGILPAPAAGSARPGPDIGSEAGARGPAVPGPDLAGVLPGAHYEDWLVHADDEIDFEPGGRVSVPFTPRAGDTLPVGGLPPRALPAGRLSGAEMVEQAKGKGKGHVSAGGEASQGTMQGAGQPDFAGPLDGPIYDPALVIPAQGTAAVLPLAETAAAPAATGLHREVFGFLPWWKVNASTLTLRYDLLSTIAYFSVGANTDGTLQVLDSNNALTTGWRGWTSSRMTEIIDAAHRNGTRVVLTISMFAWTSAEATRQAALLDSPTARRTLARQAAAAVRDRGADGINLDFEPIASGRGSQFAALVREVRQELDRIGPGYQLTFDTTGYIGNYPIEEATAPGAADAIFIMGYDYRGAGTARVGSIAPLSGPVYDITDTINAYRARVPADKLILGVPYYGRAWSTDTDQVNARNISGLQYGYSTTPSYTTAVNLAAQHGRRWDPVEQTPWTVYRHTTKTKEYGEVTSWRQLYYDDAESLGLKYDTVNRYGLRGAGIWALGNDETRPELYEVLADKFQRDTTSPLAGIRTIAPTQATESFPVSWTGWDDRGITSYDVQVSVDGGAWLDWQPGTTATSAVYAGTNGRGYAFRVRARDAAGNLGAWGISDTWTAQPILAPGGFARVTVDGLNVRSGPGTGASIVTTARSGDIVSVKAGPVSANGYSWYQVDLPLSEWGIVSDIRRGVWVASTNGVATYLEPVSPPNSTLVTLPPGAAAEVGARFVALAPSRILDTRTGNGLTGTFASSVPRTFQVTGRGGVPASALAVTGNLTITGQTSAGYVSLGPTMTADPATSTLNVPHGDIRATGVTVRLGDGGTLTAVFKGTTGARANLIFDVTGYFVGGSTGATFFPLDPARVMDTRVGNGLTGTFANKLPRTFQVTGRGGVPAGAVAVTGNLTITGQTSAGYVSLGPVMTASPSTSTLNAPQGDNRANGVTVSLDGSGGLSAVWVGTAGSRTHLLFDVTGYFVSSGAGATYFPIDNARLLDSRVGNGFSGVLTSPTPKSFAAAGRGTIPAGALAVTGTLTITGQSSAGHLSLGPSMTDRPTTSTLNAPRGDTRANGVTVPLGGLALGVVFVSASGATTHVLFDATGYFR
jgi:spore germination protein YaaH